MLQRYTPPDPPTPALDGNSSYGTNSSYSSNSNSNSNSNSRHLNHLRNGQEEKEKVDETVWKEWWDGMSQWDRPDDGPNHFSYEEQDETWVRATLAQSPPPLRANMYVIVLAPLLYTSMCLYACVCFFSLLRVSGLETTCINSSSRWVVYVQELPSGAVHAVALTSVRHASARQSGPQ